MNVQYGLGDAVEQHNIQIDTLVGRLFRPTVAKPNPAALVLSGSEGAFGWSNAMASNLAMHGLLTMAVSYFDWQGRFGLPEQLAEIALDPFAEAIAQLQSAQGTDQELTVIGYSRGAELALLLGTLYPAITRVVAYMPSALVWRGFPVATPPQSSWCYQGQPLPFAYFTDGYFDQAGWQDEAIIAQAAIPVEKIAGPLLLISGTADTVWPSTKMAAMLMARLRQHRHPYQSQHLQLEGVGHGVGVPDLANCLPTESAATDATLSAWQAMIEFLHRPAQREDRP